MNGFFLAPVIARTKCWPELLGFHMYSVSFGQLWSHLVSSKLSLFIPTCLCELPIYKQNSNTTWHAMRSDSWSTILCVEPISNKWAYLKEVGSTQRGERPQHFETSRLLCLLYIVVCRILHEHDGNDITFAWEPDHQCLYITLEGKWNHK